MTAFIGRRDFITLLGGAAVAWPLAARAQAERVRRVGLLHAQSSNDPERQASVAVFRQALGQLGWTEGRNIQFEYRWSGGNAAETRKFAAELIALAPDVLLTSGAAPSRRWCRGRATFRSCLCWSPIQSVQASWTASRAPAAT